MPAAEYVGRTFDLLALRGAKRTGDVLLSQTLFGPGAAGEVCTGVQKVAQRWAIKFMTRRGSIRFRPSSGTSFLDQAFNGRFQTEVDVNIAFQLASSLVDDEMRNEETDDMHPEDRFDSSELLALTLAADKLSLRVQINSLAGEDRKIILPIPVSPIAVRL